jgi:hypothetical protein
VARHQKYKVLSRSFLSPSSTTTLHVEKAASKLAGAWWGSFAASAGLLLAWPVIGQGESVSHSREEARRGEARAEEQQGNCKIVIQPTPLHSQETAEDDHAQPSSAAPVAIAKYAIPLQSNLVQYSQYSLSTCGRFVAERAAPPASLLETLNPSR